MLKGPECFRSILSNERRQTVFSRIKFWGLAHRRTMTVKPQNSMDECPNISGRPGYEEEARGQSFSGPFRQVAPYTAGSFDGLDNQNHKGVYFDASFVSSIYGSSSSVQPPAVAALALIKI